MMGQPRALHQIGLQRSGKASISIAFRIKIMDQHQRWQTLCPDILRAFLQHPDLKVEAKTLCQLNRHWRDIIEEDASGWIIKEDHDGEAERANETPQLPERFEKLWKKLTVVDSSLDVVEKLPNLTALTIRGRHTTKFACLRLAGPNLTHLDMSGCRKLGPVDFYLGGLPQLQTLVLTCSTVSDQDLKKFCPKLPNLEELDLGWCEHVTNEGMEPVGKLGELKRLRVFGTCVTDDGLAFLKSMTKIQELNLAGCRGVTNAGMQNLVALTGLRMLNLHRTQVNAQELKSLSSLHHPVEVVF